MLLSVIIPQYKETDKEVKRLLSSIDYQVNVNWEEVEVIIVNDCSKTLLSESMLNSFENIKPKYIKLKKNVGPGLARQAGLDAAQGEYVTFCDADDMYQNFGVFSLYFAKIKELRPDIIRTQWLEELEIENVKQYITHNFEATWMHGKVFNRGFLYLNNIRFSDKLLYHEDSYILSNAFEIAKSVIDIPTITYIWTFDKTSITRRNNGAYSYESMPEFIRSITSSLDWLKNKKEEVLMAKTVQLFLYIYYGLQANQKNWEKKYIEEIEKELVNTYRKYGKYIEEIDVASFSVLEVQERQKIANMPFVQSETFSQFLNRIVEQYK